MTSAKRDKLGYKNGKGSRKRKPKPPKPEGAPSLYQPEDHPKIARQTMGEGHSLRRLADIIGVSYSTVNIWAGEHAAFGAAIEMGREDATDKVERSLLEKASGYTRKQEKLITVAGPVGTGSQVERHTVEEHYPADTGAAKFWLTNRRKKEWSDKSEVAMTGMEALVARLASARKRTQKAEEAS